MQKSLYIDVDEEITSVIDRLRDAKCEEVAVVVPKNALILQSIVNLKLLKKEAEKLGRQIMVVTQDKLGQVLVEKAGIFVQDVLEDNGGGFEKEGAEMQKPIIGPGSGDKLPASRLGGPASPSLGGPASSKREIGSSSFYEGGGVEKVDVVSNAVKNPEEDKNRESLINRELISSVEKISPAKLGKTDSAKQAQMMDIMAGKKEIAKSIYDNKKEEPAEVSAMGGDFSPEQDDSIKNFFGSRGGSYKGGPASPSLGGPADLKEMDFAKEDLKKHGSFFKIFVILVVITLAAAAVFAAAIYVPKVKVLIFSKNKAFSFALEAAGDSTLTEVDLGKNSLPVRLVSAETEVEDEFASSGEQGVSDKKAKGVITIYNEFSDASQTLVATTRLLAEDEKLFRLVNQITVPGMKDGQPGKIQADVVADQAGDSYNVGPAKFSIPGFKGSPKYEKFYAKSETAMTGGGASSGTAKAKIITTEDIEKAKSALAEKASQASQSGFAGELGEGEMLVTSAVSSQVESYVPSQSAGTVSDKFSVKAKVVSKTLVFKEADLYGIITDEIKNRYAISDVKKEEIKIDFGKASQNLESGTITVPMEIEYSYSNPFDPEKIRTDIAGKSAEEVKAYFEGLGEVEKVELDYWPIKIGEGRIPQWEKRIEVELKLEGQ